MFEPCDLIPLLFGKCSSDYQLSEWFDE